jgi:two-component system sensor histidine kinase ChvG
LAGIARSLTLRLVLVVIVFVTVPALLYDRFRDADQERQTLLLDAIRQRGHLISRALEPLLRNADGLPVDRLQEELARYAGDHDSLKLLLRPTGQAEGGFFYVVAAPPVAPEDLDRERRSLSELGVLDRLSDSCAGELPIALRVDLSGGRSQLLTSLAPIRAPQGCWVLVGASIVQAGDRPLGLPYWQAPEVRLALVVYLVLALLVLAIVTAMLRSLRGFTATAESVRTGREGARFATRNRVPELRRIAVAFDRMVDTLRDAGRSIRDAAEENAHAFKTPIATIRQATDLLRRRVAEDARGQRAVAAVDASLARLDELIAAARQIDRSTADLLDPVIERVDLASLARGTAESHRDIVGPRVVAEAAGPVIALGTEHLVETAIENLVENALSFAPVGSEIRLRAGFDGAHATLAVIDHGPGVMPEDRTRIFDRYFSKRAPQERMPGTSGNFGLGLWIVKRNIEALGGGVAATQTPGGGLTVTIRLPRG